MATAKIDGRLPSGVGIVLVDTSSQHFTVHLSRREGRAVFACQTKPNVVYFYKGLRPIPPDIAKEAERVWRESL